MQKKLEKNDNESNLTFSVTVTLRFRNVEKPEEQSVSVGELGQECDSRPAL